MAKTEPQLTHFITFMENGELNQTFVNSDEDANVAVLSLVEEGIKAETIQIYGLTKKSMKLSVAID
jgi:hypothetical protein